MKSVLSVCMLAFVLCCCRKRDVQPSVNRSAREVVPVSNNESYPTFSGRSVPDRSAQQDNPADDLPSMTKLGAGVLSKRALEAVFQEVIGTGIDSSIILRSGKFAVVDPKSVVKGYVRELTADYTTSPTRARRIIDELQPAWKTILAGSPDYRIEAVTLKHDRRGPLELGFKAGTRYFRIYKDYASYHEFDYRVFIDPNTGHVCIVTERGPDPKPKVREQEEEQGGGRGQL